MYAPTETRDGSNIDTLGARLTLTSLADLVVHNYTQVVPRDRCQSGFGYLVLKQEHTYITWTTDNVFSKSKKNKGPFSVLFLQFTFRM